MITFILNNEKVSTGKSAGSTLLDFIRYDMDLPGTKVGCREGDCGACTVLMGTYEEGIVAYKSIVSCLTPLGNVNGKHIVTIEGLSCGHLSPVQQAFIDHSATQCGFCTPGFVMSLTAESLSPRASSKESAIASISGNICRCTGYKSIELAAESIAGTLKNKDLGDPVRWLVQQKHLPEYFLTIQKRLKEISDSCPQIISEGSVIGGGTDLMVQRPDEIAETGINPFTAKKELSGIEVYNDKLIIGAETTFNDIGQSSLVRELLPDISSYIKLIASESVRNMATIAGNIVNASPIGDFSIILLAMGADIVLDHSGKLRTVPIRELYTGYKKLSINQNEHISSIVLDYIVRPVQFSFEKVSKRTHLDIASVNSAIKVRMNGSLLIECCLSAGGVSPVPLYLSKTCAFLTGKNIDNETLLKANEVMQGEISPISDVRGSEEYKRLLLRQLLFAHFMKLLPGKLNLKISQQ